MHDPLDALSHGAALVIGIVVLIIVTVSLLRTVVVPRPLRSNFTDVINGIVIGTTRLIARARRDYKAKDSILTWGGPVLIMALLISWLLGYLVAYTFLEYGASADRTLGQAFRQAGSNLLTLGMGGVHDGTITIIDFMAAATGPIVIAMLIAFLPSVYSSYLDRERAMAELSILAGEPIWAPEWLARAAVAGSIDDVIASMPAYADWATNLRLTHTTYPVLQHIRPPRFTRHPIVTLLAMLDAANLLASLCTKVPNRPLFIMIVNGSQALGILYDLFYAPRNWRSRIPLVGRLLGRDASANAEVFPVPAWPRSLAAIHVASARDASRGMAPWRSGALHAGEQRETVLSRGEFDVAVAMLREAGLPIDRDPDAAWAMFREIRTGYEFPAYEIARTLTAVPAPWSGPRNGGIPTIWPTSVLDALHRDTLADDGPGDPR